MDEPLDAVKTVVEAVSAAPEPPAFGAVVAVDP
jgi:hypothetical protein